MARKEFKMKSGLIPDEVHLLRTITTTDVENYLQSKMDTTVASMVAKGQKQSPVTVKCYSTKAGSKIVPFVILLPLSVLVGKEKENQNNDGILDIFKTDDTSGSCDLKEEIYKTIGPYVYDANDGNAFKSDMWRREFGVSRDGSYQMSKMRKPRVTSTDHGRSKSVAIMLDPMRVFHDMMACGQVFGNETYIINVPSWKTIKTGLVSYTVKAMTYRDDKINKKKRKGDKGKDNYILTLDRRMRGSR